MHDDCRAHDIDVIVGVPAANPSPLPDARYVTPDEFEHYRQLGLERGFREVVSGTLVRSSYRAERVLQGNNVGLDE